MLLVIFGAGASYDSVLNLQPPVPTAAAQSNFGFPAPVERPPHEDSRPPLANQLFDNRRGLFAQVMDEKADYVLAVTDGEIVGAFEANEWLPATKDNFPEFSPADRPWGIREGRWAFRGRKAPVDVKALYLGKSVPKELRKGGAANPIRYVGL